MNDYSGLTADNLYQTLQKEKGREKELFESTVDTNIQSTCRVVRIFISSTFRDFYWERDVLVKTVFPKLRIWCEERNIFLLECDLRWGVPKEATGQEAVLTCLEEIEKCREEMNGRNFFLGLIGHRYGWCPGDEELNDFIKNRYSWIGGASMTLMEIILGAIRTMTPNALFMLREADFLDNMDSKMLEEFYECEEMTAKKMEQIRKFLCDVFSEKNQTHRYTCKYEETIEDSLTSEKRAKLAKLDDFGDKVYLFFKRAIENQFACELTL